MTKINVLQVKGIGIATLKRNGEDFISLTDIARNKNAEEPKDVVKNWMRSKTTIEFLGLWEQLNIPEFKGVEFDSFMFEAGTNERLRQLNQIAIAQMKSLLSFRTLKKLD